MTRSARSATLTIPSQPSGHMSYDHFTGVSSAIRSRYAMAQAGNNPLSQLIRDAMQENSWTYADLAKACDIPRASAYALATRTDQRTTNRPSTLEKLAKGLGIPLQTIRQAAAEAAGYELDEVDLTPDEAKLSAQLVAEMDPAQRRTALQMLQLLRDSGSAPPKPRKR